MNLTTLISVVSLAIIGSLCTFAVFYTGYNENLFERLGASLLAIWCFARIQYKLTNSASTDSVYLFLYIGLVLLLGGLAYSMRRRPMSARLSYLKRFFHINT